MEKANKYKESLQELNNVFYLILERYKTEYPLKEAYPTEENKSLYADSKAQLENTYKDLFVLENNVDADITNISDGSQGHNDDIQNLKSRYDKDSAVLNKLKSSDLASYPLQRQFAKKRFYNYFDWIYYSIGALLIVYLIWTGRNSVAGIKDIPIATPVFSPANAKYLPTAIATFVISPKVAQIGTASAALFAGIIAYYYS